MKKIFLVLLILSTAICTPQNGVCESGEGDNQVSAIQNRVFHKSHELGISFGYLPDDDFYEVFPIGIGYTYSFNENLAWEVAKGTYFFNQEKELKGKLEEDFGVTPSEFSEPKYMIHSSFIIKPFYGKEAIWNQRIINLESYFLLGGGFVNYERQYSYGDPATENALSMNLGFGTRYFISENLCFNLEIRDLITFKEEKTENNIYLGFTVGYRFDLFPRETERDTTIDKLKNYIKKNNEDE
jgi:outer membrane beta-barrel protein